MSLNDFNKFKPEVITVIPQIAKEKEKLLPYSEKDVNRLNNRDKLKKIGTILNTSADKGERSHIKGRTLLKSNHKEENYKEFFNLTYQSYKLNSTDMEPYIYVRIVFI